MNENELFRFEVLYMQLELNVCTFKEIITRVSVRTNRVVCLLLFIYDLKIIEIFLNKHWDELSLHSITAYTNASEITRLTLQKTLGASNAI